ncbi:MAG: ribonuclease H-like domain-containing protein [Gammaproteobacteria bacterium]|nr:ribonuclease H-like domain-containing protein [Gammaproteobacteria bacterium]
MKYPIELQEFARVRMEQTPNNTQIARDIVNKFPSLCNNIELESMRTNVRGWRKKWHLEAKQIPIRRLFFDIETGYYILKIRTFQLKNYIKYFNPDDIIKEKQILCISYQWQYEDTVKRLDIRMGEKEMLKEFIKVMEQADECVAHNGDDFDIKEIRTRCIYHGVLMFPHYRTLDTLKKSRGFFRFASNKLDYIAKFFGIGGKLETRGFDMWKDVVEGDEETSNKALDEMGAYCDRDVIILADTFFVLSPFITHNNNFAVLTGGQKWECPECASSDVEMFRSYSTPMGIIRREMKCNDCKKQYKVSNKTYMSMLESLMNR